MGSTILPSSSLKELVPIFAPSNSKGHVEKLFEGSQEILRELATDVLLEGTSRRSLEKTRFLLGDIVVIPDEALYMHEHKWLRKVKGVRMFLSDMIRSYQLAYLQKLSVPHSISWHVTKE